MYQKLLRNIWEFFLFEEVLSGLLLQEIKKWNRQCFLSLPSSHTKTSVFILNMFWTNLQHFYLFYFLFPKTTKEGSSWSSFWHSDGSVLPEIVFFLEVTRNKRFELNEYIWKNTIKYYSTHIASFFFKFPSLIFLYLYIIPNKYPTHHYFDSGIELDTVHWILNR